MSDWGRRVRYDRSLLWIAAILLWGAATPAFLGLLEPEAAIAQETPVLFVAEPTLDGGRAMEGTRVPLAFTVANRGEGVLVIRQVTHSRGSFVKAYPKRIDPGTSGEVRVGLTTDGQSGKIQNSFYLYTNDPQAKRFRLRGAATVTPLISVAPDRVYFNGFAEQPYRTSIVIRNNTENPLTLKPVQSSLADHVDHRMVVEKSGSVYRLDISAHPKPGDYFRGRLIMETNFTRRPRIIIPVLGRIMKEVEVMPPVVNFGIRLKKDYVEPPEEETVRRRDWQKNRQQLPQHLFLRVNRGEDVQLKDFSVDHPLFIVDMEVLAEGKLYRLSVSPQIDRMSPGDHETVLRLRTAPPSQASFDILIRLIVK